MENFYKRKIEWFQVLRALAALFIVFEHVRFLRCGLFGVDIFFVLSGFMAVYSSELKSDNFLLKRIIRIVPLYWIMTLATLLTDLISPSAFKETVVNESRLLYSLLFIPFDMNTGEALSTLTSDSVIQPLMRVGWTLNMEMFFYVLFSIALKINKRLRVVITSAFIVLLIIIGRFAAVPVLSLWSSPLMLEFCAGMALCRLCAFLSKKHVSSVLSKLSAILILPIMIALALYYRDIQNDFSVHLVFLLGAIVLILLAFLAEENVPAIKPLVNVGNISYSLYLMHYYIILSLDRFFFDFTGPSVKAFVGLFLGVLVSLLISWLTYAVIEKRFGLFLNKAFTKKAD